MTKFKKLQVYAFLPLSSLMQLYVVISRVTLIIILMMLKVNKEAFPNM